VHYALAVLIARAAEAADLDPDRISFTRTLRLVRRTATGTAAFPPDDWITVLPEVLAEIARKPNPARRHRSCPRAVKRARHNSYRIKKPGEAASIRHAGPPTIAWYPLRPRSMINLSYAALALVAAALPAGIVKAILFLAILFSLPASVAVYFMPRRLAVISSRTRADSPPWLERDRDALVTNAIVSAAFLLIGILIGYLLPK
jgi:hypothetical protein